MNNPKRGEIYWANLDPTIGTEIGKKRPAVILSNDVSNVIASRVIVAPLTSNATKIFPFEVPINLKGKNGKILLDQIRSIDKLRINDKISACDDVTLELIAEALKIALALP